MNPRGCEGVITFGLCCMERVSEFVKLHCQENTRRLYIFRSGVAVVTV